jgi:hypothetical protein
MGARVSRLGVVSRLSMVWGCVWWKGASEAVGTDTETQRKEQAARVSGGRRAHRRV